MNTGSPCVTAKEDGPLAFHLKPAPTGWSAWPVLDLLGLLGVRPDRASRLTAAQSPFAPPQLHDLPGCVQVLDPYQRTVLHPAGDDPASWTGTLSVQRFDDDPQTLLAEPFQVGDDELVIQPEQH